MMSFVPRLYLDPIQSQRLEGNHVYDIPISAVHYLGNVLRLKIDDPVVFFNEINGEWQCKISAISKNKGTFETIKQLRVSIVPVGPTLVFAPLKRDATDLAIRMATELGVKTIQPVKTLRTNITKIKEERWHAIAVEAAEQSNRLTIPEIKPIMSLFELCELWPKDKILWVAVERAVEQQISIDSKKIFQGDEGILIGPEGGFDPVELKNLLMYNFVRPLSFGNLILKAETAIVAGLTQFFQYVDA